MAEITASAVGKLREATNAGLMDCKKALSEANGDFDAAVDILRKKGQASAAKKSGRAAKEGVISSYIAPGAKVGVLAEVNCETDFVARNESFRAFCDEIAEKYAANPNADLEADRVAAVSKVGENILLGRHTRIEVTGNGLVAAYIHTGAKVGVLVEVGANKDETTQKEEFKQLVRDITLQIAAASPGAVRREEVAKEIIEKEDEINRQSDRLKGKPPQAMEKILQGMREKFYQTFCLVDQGFVKNPDMTVGQHIGSASKQLGDEIVVRRLVRFQVGEGAAE
jgi:elongation factor Ts